MKGEGSDIQVLASLARLASDVARVTIVYMHSINSSYSIRVHVVFVYRQLPAPLALFRSR